jgi:hypothetical protein
MNTAKILKLLTIASTALAAFAAGLGTLPIDSASLPLPPEWRPYLMGTAFIAASVRVVVLPVLDAITKSLQESK